LGVSQTFLLLSSLLLFTTNIILTFLIFYYPFHSLFSPIGFTGVDDPYEAPLNAEIVIPNYKMSIEQSVDLIMRKLKEEGCLVGGPTLPHGTTTSSAHVQILMPYNSFIRYRSFPFRPYLSIYLSINSLIDQS